MAFGRFEVSGGQERSGQMTATPVALAGTPSVSSSRRGRSGYLGAPCDAGVGNRG